MAFQTKADFGDAKTVTLGKAGEPKTVEGYFLGTKTTPDRGYGPGKLHFFQTKAGIVGVWGKTVLNNLLTPDMEGQMVRATFTGMGEKKKGKNPAFLFTVEFDPENVIKTAGIGAGAAESPENEEDANYSSDSSYEEETSDDEEEKQADEVPPARAAAPKQPAPTANKASRVQDLLNRGRNGKIA